MRREWSCKNWGYKQRMVRRYGEHFRLEVKRTSHITIEISAVDRTTQTSCEKVLNYSSNKFTTLELSLKAAAAADGYEIEFISMFGADRMTPQTGFESDHTTIFSSASRVADSNSRRLIVSGSCFHGSTAIYRGWNRLRACSDGQRLCWLSPSPTRGTNTPF